MKRRWTIDELAEHWTLHADELSMDRSPNTSSNQLGLALLLKWFQYEGQFETIPNWGLPLVMSRDAAQYPFRYQG